MCLTHTDSEDTLQVTKLVWHTLTQKNHYKSEKWHDTHWIRRHIKSHKTGMTRTNSEDTLQVAKLAWHINSVNTLQVTKLTLHTLIQKHTLQVKNWHGTHFLRRQTTSHKTGMTRNDSKDTLHVTKWHDTHRLGRHTTSHKTGMARTDSEVTL